MGELLQPLDEQAVTVHREDAVVHQVIAPVIDVTVLSPSRRSLWSSR